MNRTVELVNLWGAFEEAYPDGSIEDFCRYHLTAQQAQRNLPDSFGGATVPPDPGAYLIKILGYLTRIFETYSRNAVRDVPEIRQPNDFYFLNMIYFRSECKKTDVINGQMEKLSTGIEVLNHLLTNDLIKERPDPTDKRARLVSITPQGEAVLWKCHQQLQPVTRLMFTGVSEQDLQLCIQLLKGVEARHSAHFQEWKDLPVEEVLARASAAV